MRGTNNKIDKRLGVSESERIEKIFEALEIAIPNPTTELQYINTYTLLVAVVLSAQTTDIQVNKATKGLFEVVQSAQDMLNLGIDKLQDYIKTLNYYKTKSANVIKLSQDLVDKFGSEVPRVLEDLISLAGVGIKTANVVLNTAFGEGVIAVDTHVHRVCNRVGICKTTTPAQTSEMLPEVVPSQYKKDAHHLLILHGRYVCKAKKPICENCVIRELCRYNTA